MRRLVAERRIPFLKWGHLLRFDPDEISRWLDECRVRPPCMSTLQVRLGAEPARSSGSAVRYPAHERRLQSPLTEGEPWAGAERSGTSASCRRAVPGALPRSVGLPPPRPDHLPDDRRHERVALHDRNRDRTRRVDRTRSSAITFESYADSWLESRPGLRPRTVELYRSLLDRHLVPVFGDHELGKLTAPSVRRWYTRLLREADQSTVTLAKCYRLLRAILNTAVGDELIVRNPCTINGAGIERSPERPVATMAQVWKLADSVEPRFRCWSSPRPSLVSASASWPR